MLCLLAWFYILYRGTTSFINLADITITQNPRSVVKVTVFDWLLSLYQVKVTVFDWLVSLYQDKTSFDSPDMIHSPKVQNSRLN